MANLTPSDWEEIKRITHDIMDCVLNAAIFTQEGRDALTIAIQSVLAQNIMAGMAASEAEEIHTWEFGKHHISECRPDWCGHYRGQRRDTDGSL